MVVLLVRSEYEDNIRMISLGNYALMGEDKDYSLAK